MLAGELAAFAAGVTFADLPPAVVVSVRQRFLDTIGLALAGTAQQPARSALSAVQGWGGNGEAGLLGLPGRFPAVTAALVNGTLAHALDFDDTHLPSILHPSATLVPTALAAAEAAGAGGRALIAATAAGYEVCIRLGMAAYDENTRNSVFFEKGLHATSICGTMAGAVVAAKLFGGDEVQIRHALGIAASMAAGLLEANRTGGSVKRLHCGWAAHSAVAAAQLAAAGFTGPDTVLEGKFGFFQALCDGRYDAARLVAGLGEHWETPGIFFKPYPANHFTHAGIDAAIQLRDEEGIRPEQIERIDLGVAGTTLRTIGEPREKKVRPESGYHAQFSGPYTVAAALLGGSGLGLYLDDFTDQKVRDPQRLDLAGRVHCHSDPACEAVFPDHFPAVLRVTLKDGQVYERRVMENRGSPARPLSPSELRLKFELNASHTLPADRVGPLADLCARLDQLESVTELTEATRP